ncbi:Guanine nucleotide-binding protein-like 3 [Gaertneriomyces sp. JEL0708]|nr:Guanine nucleotide-binding protein-like 3 [Gaertneriomyces sp. JEL0708]
MVPKKAKSKRVSAAMRYKIEKRVTEHHRKQRREAKKNPQTKRQKKDPGIPNLFPFKDKLLEQAEEAKRKREEERQRQKEDRGKLVSGNRHGLEDMVRNAQKRAADFEKISIHSEDFEYLPSDAALSTKDNSRKAYYKEFRKVVEQADVILEVLDARDPLGCRTKQIEELILNAGASKRIILILNKIDLVPREAVEAWLKYLRNEFPTVAFKASTQAQRTNLGQKTITDKASEGLLSSSECLGADTLVSLLKNYSRNNHMKTSITVGVIGFPNVGKSSVINSLKRSRVCSVGSTPGVTKVAQTIQLDKNVKLLDCPGIVFSTGEGADTLLRNCVKVELVEDPISPVEVILGRAGQQQLQKLYNIPPFSSTQDFLIHIARQRGKLRRGGIPDIDNAARSILNDWNSGRIPFYTTPPKEAPERHVGAAVVAEWGKEFEIPVLEEEQVLQGTRAKQEIGEKMVVMEAGATADVDMDYEIEDESEEDAMDEDEDDMEEDTEAPTLVPADKPAIHFKSTTLRTSKKSALIRAETEADVLDSAEMGLETQKRAGKDKKKLERAKKKADRRKAKGAAEGALGMDIETGADEAYDFAEHFGSVKLPGDDSDEDL